MTEIEDIIKFFFNYFKVFKMSSSSNVANWTLFDIRNALKWSSNCEELFIRIKSKPFFDELLLKLIPILDHWKLFELYNESSFQENLAKSFRKIKQVAKYIFKIIKIV